jgi:hypothetical protein
MFESKLNRGRANGYAPLDGDGKVPLDKLPPIQSTIDTGSFATTGSNQFNGNQSVSGSLTTAEFIQTSTLQGTGSLYLKPDLNDSRHFEIYNTSPTDTHIKANGGISFFGDDTNYLKIEDGAGDVTLRANQDITLQTGNGNIVLNPDGNAYIGSANSGNGIVTDGYLAGIIGDTNTVNNSTGHTLTDNLTNIINSIPTIPAGTISGSAQITELGFISSSTTIDTGSFATTGSNSFNGNQSITGSLSISVSTGIPSGVSNWNGQGGWNQGFYSNITASGGTGTGLTVDVAAGGGGYINISAISINNPGSGYTNGDIVTIDNENNLPGQFTIEVGANNFEFNTSGSLVFPDSTTQTTAFNSGKYATTGSNTFNGNQIISGSLTIASGSSIYGLAQYSGAVLFQPVADPDPLSQATTGTHLFVSSSNNQTGEDLYFRQQDNKVKWKWVEGKLNTGILTGGVISYSGSLVYVKAGTGIIMNHNASLTEEISPVTTYVSWNDYTASCQNITSSLATYLYVDNAGTIHQTDTYFTVDQYRTSLPLGMVNHTGKNVITSVANNVATAYDDVSQTSDFIRAFGPMKLRGLSITPATNSLKFTIEAGTSYILGGFYQQNPNNSSHKETPLIQTGSLSIARVRRDGSGGFIVDNNSGSFYNSIDSHYYDDGTGTLNSTGTGQWQIQRVFFNPFTNRCHIYYGQTVYTSFINAKQYLSTDPFVEADYSSHQYVFIGYLIVKGQTNNLADDNNNLVVQSGLFRNTVGSSGGIQTFTHLHDLADVEVADPSNKDLLSYNSSTALWEHHTFGYLGLATTSSLNGVISGSSQLTSSFDTRYTLSGSVSAVPSGTVSGSSQLTSSFDGRYVQTSSFNSFTASALTTGSNTFSGSQIISGALYVTSITSISSSFSLPSGSSLMILSGSNIYVDSSGSITGSLSGSVFGIGDVVAFSASVNSRLNSAGGAAGVISGSAQITAFGFVSGSYETTGRSIVSGSSQLTSSYDTRYTLSGSVSAVPTGTISGSSQLTSSFDLRYLVTGSVTSSISQLNTFTASVSTASLVTSINNINSFTSSLNILTSSLATTGSNSFNGAQTITGSLTVSSVAVVSASVTLPSGSVLSLTSGSNLVIQNNGTAEITGSLKVSGSTISLITTTLQVGTGSGDEGGEILLAKSVTNNSLTGSGITIDSYQNRLRIFEQGGAARGVHIDLTKAPDGVAGELMWKASGIVNAGTFVQLDNIKATVTTSGNRGLSIAAVSTTFSANTSAIYASGASSGGAAGVISVTTTASTSLYGWNFGTQTDTATYIINDTTTNKAYRITMLIGGSYNNNVISIERLV